MLNFRILFKQKLATVTHKEEGFTLVELVIVMAVLATLAAIAIPIYSAQVKEGLLATLKADVTQTAGALSNATNATDQELRLTTNPCTAASFNKVKVVTDAKNVLTCTYYGSSTPATTGALKKQAYQSYEWCVQGARTTDINATWSYNSRNESLKEGICQHVGTIATEEAIG